MQQTQTSQNKEYKIKEDRINFKSKFLRSSKHSLKFSNIRKLTALKLLICEYRRLAALITTYIFQHGFDSRDYIYKKPQKLNIFNFQNNQFDLPSMFPMGFAHKFEEKTFLSLTKINKICNHVSDLIRGSVKKYFYDLNFLTFQVTSLTQKNPSPKSKSARDLAKFTKRLNNLKLNPPSTKNINIRFESDNLDLLVNNADLFEELMANKSVVNSDTGEVKEPKNIILNPDSNNKKKEFDFFAQFTRNLPRYKDKFKETLDKLKKDKEFLKVYNHYYLILDNEKVKFLNLETEEIYDLLKSIKIPVKTHKIFNKWSSLGKFCDYCEISLEENYVKFSFEIKVKPKKSGLVAGADQGFKNVLTLSDSSEAFAQQTQKCIYINKNLKSEEDILNLSRNQRKRQRRKLKEHSLESICLSLSRAEKGTKRFKRLQEYRKILINTSINLLDFSDFKVINYEKVKDLRLGKRQKVLKMIHWSYPLIKGKVVSVCELQGLQFTEVTNCYRSQRCNSCGWVQRENRVGGAFKCCNCQHMADADLNAAKNLSLDLFPLDKKYIWEKKLVCQNSKIKFGFYWFANKIEFLI